MEDGNGGPLKNSQGTLGSTLDCNLIPSNSLNRF